MGGEAQSLGEVTEHVNAGVENSYGSLVCRRNEEFIRHHLSDFL